MADVPRPRAGIRSGIWTGRQEDSYLVAQHRTASLPDRTMGLEAMSART